MLKVYHHIDSKNISQNPKEFYTCITTNATKLIKLGNLCFKTMRASALNVRGFPVSAAQKTGGIS